MNCNRLAPSPVVAPLPNRPQVITDLLAADDTGTVANYIRRLEAKLQVVAPLPHAPRSETDLPRNVSVVPIDGGRVQIEGHTKGQDWEILINADGDILSLSWERCETAARPRSETDDLTRSERLENASTPQHAAEKLWKEWAAPPDTKGDQR